WPRPWLIPNCGELDSSWPTSALERCAHISLDHRTFLRSMSRWKSRTMTQGLRVLLLQGDPIDLGQVLRRQRPPRGAHVLLDLLRRGGTGDDAGDRALAQQPPKRQLEHGVSPARGECLEFADDAPVALVDELLGVAWVLRQPRPRRQRCAALVLAGQQAAGEREVGQYPQSECLGRRNERALDVAHEQAVSALTGHYPGKPVPTRRGLRFDDLLRRQIRAAEEAHLALPHQIIERAQGLLDRGLRVRAMQLVKVDPIGAQP